MERMWKTPKERAEKYKRINARFSLVYWYNRTGLSDVVPSFRLQTLPKSFSSFHVPDRSFFEPQKKRIQDNGGFEEAVQINNDFSQREG